MGGGGGLSPNQAVKPGLGPGASVLWVSGCLGLRGQSWVCVSLSKPAGPREASKDCRLPSLNTCTPTALSTVSLEQSCVSLLMQEEVLG